MPGDLVMSGTGTELVLQGRDGMPALKPGLAFSPVTDSGFAVDLYTRRIEAEGYVICMAEPTYDESPTLAQVRAIHRWRWPIFFPLGAALRRKLVRGIARR